MSMRHGEPTRRGAAPSPAPAPASPAASSSSAWSVPALSSALGSPVSVEGWDTRSCALPAEDTAPAVRPAPVGGAAPVTGTARRGPADPVREVMHRHRALCERAVDPLEIAAGLEAHGVTDRTAARFRHRDVFSLAEELYARVPRAEAGDALRAREAADPRGAHDARGAPDPRSTHGAPGARYTGAEGGTGGGACGGARGDDPAGSRTAAAGGPATRRGRSVLVHTLPGVLCAATLAVFALCADSSAPVRVAVGAVGAGAVGISVRMSLRRLVGSAPAVLPALAAYWLLAYALFGDWLLAELLGGGPGPGLSTSSAPAVVFAGMSVPLSLTVALAPAALCAHRFAKSARRELGSSRTLGEFAASVRPLLCGTVLLFTVALLGTQLLTGLALGGGVDRALSAGLGGAPDGGPPAGPAGPSDGPGPAAALGGTGTWGTLAGTTALGVLLFVALLLTVHGFPAVASVGLGAASLTEAAVLAWALAARRSGTAELGGPLERVATAYGPAAVPVAVCGCAALVLLAYAARALAGASAHHGAPPP